MKKYIKLLIILTSVLILSALITGLLIYCGVIHFNNPSEKRYPIRGVDVSAYQGEVDWEILSEQGISFAFIKATEGSSFVDRKFADNYDGAMKTGLRIGAYHFFSYDSSGENQAKNFISVVPKDDKLLPPVIDLEFYGDKEKNLPAKTKTQQELAALIAALEEHYGKKPIIYATEKSYRLYVAGAFVENDIWIRNVFTKPTLSDGREWTFWQYTNRERLQGYSGVEKFIDMNVFNGTKEDFEKYFD
ncbi:MAG: glycoside hydrolase family 25 protein [Clostridiales bacterium]|nr:glycoside hydrolase family 25 protein [Clostridiales bacterium]